MVGHRVLTAGRVRHMTHKQAHQAIRFMGGEISRALDDGTTILLYGENPGNVEIQAKNRRISRMHHSDFHKVLAIAVEARNEDWENWPE